MHENPKRDTGQVRVVRDRGPFLDVTIFKGTTRIVTTEGVIHTSGYPC